MSATDLFWEPAVGEKVRIRQSAMWRHRGVIGSDGPHTVISDAGSIESNGEFFRMFWITRDGPISYRTDAKGRRHEIKPSSQTPVCLQDIEPVTP